MLLLRYVAGGVGKVWYNSQEYDGEVGLLYCIHLLKCKHFLRMAAYGYHQRPALIGPSLLAADLSNLTSESIRVLDAGADYLHLDVMVIFIDPSTAGM
jgi:hypothetical protein